MAKDSAARARPALRPNSGVIRGAVSTSASFPIAAVCSSGGERAAFTAYLQQLPERSGIATIFIQLESVPAAEMAALLAPYAAMPVREVTERTTIAPDTIYVVSQAALPALRGDELVVKQLPEPAPDARAACDSFLRSLAENAGQRAIAIIMSGNGLAGSLGIRVIQEFGGLTIAQEPTEAAQSQMPQSAINTGAVDLVLPAGKIPQAIITFIKQTSMLPSPASALPQDLELDFKRIVELLVAKEAGDFRAYKPSIMMRRVACRMAVHVIDDFETYVKLLHSDPREIEVLAKELLIHATSFYRNPIVFDHLAEHVIPQMVLDHPPAQPLRVWVPACSTGEEVYSLTMAFLEAIAAAKKTIQLQVFASDIDEQVITFARVGRYPPTIDADVSAERLGRFFTKDGADYLVGPTLRECVIFTVQNLLKDPPIARIDFLACRNLLMYLLPEEQHRVLSLLHLSLRKNGILLLGLADSIGVMQSSYKPLEESLRIYQRVENRKLRSPALTSDRSRMLWPGTAPKHIAPEADLGKLARDSLLAIYAPASALIDQDNQALYFFGATENYFQLPDGEANGGIFSLLRPSLRSKFRAALRLARNQQAPVSAPAGAVTRADRLVEVQVDLQRISARGRELFLASFIDLPPPRSLPTNGDHLVSRPVGGSDLEGPLDLLRKELEDIAMELEAAYTAQDGIHETYQTTIEEMDCAKKELQTLNEELATRNRHLAAAVEQQRLNAEDIESVLRCSEQAVISLDLQHNIRFVSPAAKSMFHMITSDIGRPISDLALRFDDDTLDSDIHSVLKTSASVSREVRSHIGDWYTRRVLTCRTPGDVVRGVIITFHNISQSKADAFNIESARSYANSIIDSLPAPLVVVDGNLRVISSNPAFRRAFTERDEIIVNQKFKVIGGCRFDVEGLNDFLEHIRRQRSPVAECEVTIDQGADGPRTLLVRARKVAGESDVSSRILLVLDDITERAQITTALEVAKLRAERANLGKSRFLAAASHDLRQPLQTLSLLHGILSRTTTDLDILKLVGKSGETLGAMAGILDALLDINQLETGNVQPEIRTFDIMTVFETLATEFTYLATARNLSFKIVSSSLRARSDPLLLAQVLRNLLSNAVKYTSNGKILMGCRRAGDKLRIEVWDTGIGIPENQLKAVFEEYHQLGNPARERGLGLGLGLSIVRRIAELLGHRIGVHSTPGKGSAFTIELPLDPVQEKTTSAVKPSPNTDALGTTILILEDDPAVREALIILFKGEGYRVLSAANGVEAIEMTNPAGVIPDVIVADYNLPGGKTGLEIVTRLRRIANREIPAVILTGDITTEVIRKIAAGGCEYLHKPVHVTKLLRRIYDFVAHDKPADTKRVGATSPGTPDLPLTVFIVDDDRALSQSMADMLALAGYAVEVYTSAESFLEPHRGERKGCLIVDSVMPGISGLDLLKRLKSEGRDLPSIVITGYGDVAMAIKAMKAGAIDFIEKPARQETLIASIERALMQARDMSARSAAQNAAAANIASLTAREREVMDLVVQGIPNKQIAHKLQISQRTVETHRAAVMKRTGVESLPDLIRLVMQLN